MKTNFKHHEEFPNEQIHYQKLLDEIELLPAKLRSKDQIIKNIRNATNGSKPSTELSDKTKSKFNMVKKTNGHIDKQDVGDVSGPQLHKHNKQNVTIIDDSIVEEINPFKMKRMLGNDKLYVKYFRMLPQLT